MKQLFKELIYRNVYTTLGGITLLGFIYLNYACEMEYFWFIYHMEGECVDFCWKESLESMIPDIKTHNKYIHQNSSLSHQHTCNIQIHHQIAHVCPIFLTLVCGFIEHVPNISLTFRNMIMLWSLPMILLVIFQMVCFWLPAIVVNQRPNTNAKLHFGVFILWVHHLTLSNNLTLVKQFQIEPNDSELFASGHGFDPLTLANVYFTSMMLGFIMVTLFFFGTSKYFKSQATIS